MTVPPLDPITVEVVRNKLDSIANEMQSSLLRSSFSPIVKEGLDASASLFLPDGTAIAQSTSIAIHLGTLIPAVGQILASYPPATMRPGDVYILNDPYLGGTHLPDIAICMPAFHNDRVLGLAATMVHHQDVGGMMAGSVPTNATEIFQEGIRIPPLKLRDGDVMNDTLVRLLRQNVRLPDTFFGDLNAQIAACSIGNRRLGELAARHGHNLLTQIFAELVERAELLTRQALARIPDGTYRYVDWLDNDGVELDKRVRIEVAVTIEGSDITFDLAGSSDQVRGPFNCVPSGAQAAAYFAVRAITDPHIPNNGGCFRSIVLKLPEGSIVNPREPAPVNARTETIKRITTSMLAALAPIVPDRLTAQPAGIVLVLAYGGKRADGSDFIISELIAGGSGAHRDGDGVDVIETDVGNGMNLPAEALEMDAPIRVRRIGLRRDSGGAGRWRGGLGQVREYEILDGPISFAHRGERHTTQAEGLAGGGPGASAVTVITRADGTREIVKSKLVTALARGDRVRMETPGGGGYGDPGARDPARRADDVADGKVTA
jgi:N-methylhydantoinase B